MKFWRNKREAAKEAVPKIETATEAEPSSSPPPVPEPAQAGLSHAPGDSEDTVPKSNVVAITSSKLSDRIAAAGLKSSAAVAQDKSDTTIEALDDSEFPGQERACQILEDAIARRLHGAHVLVLGPAGTGRYAAVLGKLEQHRAALPKPADWIYLSEAARPLKPFSLPHGQGAMFAREVEAAIVRTEHVLERMLASDDYRLAVEVIDEEFRHRNDKALDDLKRRAEGQNIAIVKTAEGFVLAPMHEGKAVRADVFRALPDSLQREVEAKIAALEGELNSYIGSLSQTHLAHSDRLAALNRDTASRAVKSQLEAVRAAFSETEDIVAEIEAAVVHAALTGLRRQPHFAPHAIPVRILVAQAAGDFAAAAPVVVSRDLSAQGLFGEVGATAIGEICLRAGELMRVNGGFLVADAWRLATEPQAWARLSAALELGAIRPLSGSGCIAEGGSIPINVRLVLIAEPQTLAKLKDIDPGFLRHFPQVVRFEGEVPDTTVDSEAYGKLAARIAKHKALLPLSSGCSEVLHKEACRRSGNPGSISLETMSLEPVLYEADRLARGAGSDRIRSSDLDEAIREAEKGRLP